MKSSFAIGPTGRTGQDRNGGVQIFEPSHRRKTFRNLWILPLILAALFAGLSLRNLRDGSPVDTDAARHAMNGAFIRDAIATGHILHPIEYGKEYYSRLPALSMPYHPPLFPIIEALFFSVFGVHYATARAVVALSVAISALLYYGLIIRILRSHAVAVCSTLCFFSWRFSQVVGGGVMLEFPSFAFVLASLHCLWSAWTSGPNAQKTKKWYWSAGIGFGVFAAAALWTKQHALLLGIVPFALAIFEFNKRAVRNYAVWAGLAIWAASAIILAKLSEGFGNTGADQLLERFREEGMMAPITNLLFYLFSAGMFGLVFNAALVSAVVLWLVFLRGQSRGMALFSAWAASGFVLLLILGPHDARYMFYVLPGLAVVVFDSLTRLSQRLFERLSADGWKWAPIPVLTIALLQTGSELRYPAPYLDGPAEVAAAIVPGSPKRILYCGDADGNFIFDVRSLDPGLRSVVLSGQKVLAGGSYSSSTLQSIAQKYQVTHVVVERTHRKQDCDALHPEELSTMQLIDQQKLSSSLARYDGGTLRVYRYTGTYDKAADRPLNMEIPRIGASVDVRF